MAIDIHLYELIRQLSEGRLKVDFQLGDGHEGGLSVAQIAAFNEYGTSRAPARPFMRPAFFENRTLFRDKLRNIARRQLQGHNTFERDMSLLGVFVVNKIRTQIDSVTSPPNAPFTIARKRSSKPLIDTGEMKRAVKAKYVGS